MDEIKQEDHDRPISIDIADVFKIPERNIEGGELLFENGDVKMKDAFPASPSSSAETVRPTKPSSYDDDDPIVQDFPIYISSSLANQLYLLQYPVRSKERPYVGATGEAIHDLKIKPKSGVLQVDVPINTTKYYDGEKTERWGHVNKQTLSGVVKPCEGYMVGIFKNGELF